MTSDTVNIPINQIWMLTISGRNGYGHGLALDNDQQKIKGVYFSFFLCFDENILCAKEKRTGPNVM